MNRRFEKPGYKNTKFFFLAAPSLQNSPHFPIKKAIPSVTESVQQTVQQPTVKSSGGWKRHWAWAKWLVALGMMAFVLWKHREGVSKLAQQPLHWPSLLAAFCLCSGAIVLTFLRWYLLVWAQGFAFHVRDALRLGFIGYLFNFVGPGSVGGDVVKAALIAKEQPSRRTTAIATVLLDRILGLLALFVIGACAACPQWETIREQSELKGVVWLLAGGSVAGLIGLALMLIPVVMRLGLWKFFTQLPAVGKPIGELIEGVRLYQTRPGVLMAALGISLLGHFGIISAFYFSARSVGGGAFVPSYLSHLFFIPAAEFIGVVLPVPGGIGPLEWAVERFYHHSGAADGTGILTCLAYRAVTLAVALIGAGYYLTARREIAAAMQTHD